MNTKDIFFGIALIVLIGLSYYLYSGLMKCKVVATDLGAQLQECGTGIDQLQIGLQECMTQATQCQEALVSLQETCAPYLPTE